MEKKLTPLVGAHVSIAGGLHKAIERAEALGGTTMQIFTKNSKAWFGKPIPQEEAERFRKALKESNLKGVMAHASYLINIASPKPEMIKKSIAGLKHELHRCEELNIPYLILHPGAHTGSGEEKGLEQVSKSLDAVLETANGTTKILLETMAGQGTSLGHTFEQIKTIYQNCKHKKLLGVCLDTCHIFAAGYDIRTEKAYTETMTKFSKVIGLSRLKAIHLNGSKTELGSHKDRHENLGDGYIPNKTFQLIMQDERLVKIPKVLETPSEDGVTEYTREIKLLKRYAG